MREHEIITVSEEALNRQREFAAAVRAHPARPGTYYIVTYGCQMNAHDSETLAGMLGDMGLTEAPCREEADFVLHNTCCIRDNAQRKALGNVTWLKEIKRERPDMLIGVCGCMMQQPGMAQKILKQYPFVDIAFGTGNLYQLPEFFWAAIEEKRRVVAVSGEDSTLFEGLPSRRESDIKAYVTIMYGCDNFCSYCIVPYVRGRERSRSPEAILREVAALKDAGVQEIMLLGQNVNSYGRGLDGMTFAKLLSEVADIGVPRIRFMTSHPKDLSDELIAVMASRKNVCPHLHLPVQSGSDAILAAMNRKYTRAQYLRRVAALRAAMPHIGLSTDLIVGFPGETERDFADTLSLCEEVRYDSAFTFIYSPREGTKAAAMDGRVQDDVATARIEKLIAAQNAVTEEILTGMKGQTASVLCEGASKRSAKQMTGKSERGVSVNFDGDAGDIGRIVTVTITGAGKSTLRAKKTEGQP